MEDASEMRDFESLRGDHYDPRSLRESVIFSMVNGLELARSGNYESLKRFFGSDYEKTSNLIRYIADTDSRIFDIGRDTIPNGFLQQIGRNVLSGNPVAKDCLAKELSKIFSRGIFGGIESATYIIPSVFIHLLVNEKIAAKTAEKIREKIFCQKRERQYREILN